MRTVLLLLLMSWVLSAPAADLMDKVPGYPSNYSTKVYSGYLSTGNENRSLHYVFVESVAGSSTDQPLTLWLNGGPGCSSMMGFLQEIGPYYLEDGVDYKVGDNLTFNPYSWHNHSHLLFIESPAGVGYSYNLETNFTFTDHVVTEDSMAALLDFFKKFPEYRDSKFWIAGESYAGIYIPNLAAALDKYNANATLKINLRGILVGNGAMDFTDNSLTKSTVQFFLEREFVDPDLVHYWNSACAIDEDSAGCKYFYQRFQDNSEKINPYSVYSHCYYNDSFNASATLPKRNRHSQQSCLMRGLARMQSKDASKYNGAPCCYFDGMYNYFNLNKEEYHAKFKEMVWNGPCAENVTDNYRILESGSMNAYRYLLTRLNLYKIVLYNGNWDSAVPYQDTKKNLLKLGTTEQNLFKPWHLDKDGEHAGFIQVYSGVDFITFKGASHMVPQSKRAAAVQMFKDTLSGHNATVTSSFSSFILE